ncbi:MAG TPA: glycosyltransferase [Minicystis sp.]|nr:glycosyltransferase [Minicystis sp.]
MKIVVFGLTVSSSWGNGHATLWRGLARGLADLGHRVVFFERDVPYYAEHRDATTLDGGELCLYRALGDVLGRARAELADADVGMVTSYCPDARAAAAEVLGSSAEVHAFYDLDTPVTLERLARGERVDYVPEGGLGEFDLVLSYTGGRALDELRTRLGARRVEPLYGSVDPRVHRPVTPDERFRADLAYLGTYAADRQPALEAMFLEVARRLPSHSFLIGGSLYPPDFPWRPNVRYWPHVAPPLHAAFYASSSIQLSVTRRAMAEMGHCPSGRLFESAACGTPVLTDPWEGVDSFFEPGREILVARTTDEVVAHLSLGPERLAAIGQAARARVLAEHTAKRRAEELVAAMERAARRRT